MANARVEQGADEDAEEDGREVGHRPHRMAPLGTIVR
jgi:hypothetical protein